MGEDERIGRKIGNAGDEHDVGGESHDCVYCAIVLPHGVRYVLSI